jgi:pimeloyl-ACP methyl ester carboxylesterase
MAGGAAVITVRHLLDTPQPLNSGLPGEARIDRRHGGDLYYTIAGPADAQPMLLLHDFYPGASNFEYRTVFSALADRYRVYAPDWLGFGMSEHPNIAYTGEFYAHVLTGFVRDVVARPVIVVAHGLAANIAVRAASDTPALFERLILVSPDDMAGMRQGPTAGQTVVRATQRAMLGLVPYALLSTKTALRLFSRGGSRLDVEAASEDLHHRYASAHQFGGHHAALALLTGELDLPIRHVFPLLEQPSLIISGEDDPRHLPEEMEDLAVLNPRADLDILPGIGAAILEERPNEFLHFVDRWLSTPITSPHGRGEPALVGAATPTTAATERADSQAIAEDVTPEAETSYHLGENENAAASDTWPEVPMDAAALGNLGKAASDPQMESLAEESVQAEAGTATDEAATATSNVETPENVATPDEAVATTDTVITPTDEAEVATPEEAAPPADTSADEADAIEAIQQQESSTAEQPEPQEESVRPPTSRAARRQDGTASTRVPLAQRSGSTARSRSTTRRTGSSSGSGSTTGKRSSSSKGKSGGNTRNGGNGGK